ncbi:MAG: hypothetical protein QOJ19_1208, partial [Acidimicrobiia bacterium]|nr:hypothetical protein [Acidimicrobiia bacterium]
MRALACASVDLVAADGVVLEQAGDLQD